MIASTNTLAYLASSTVMKEKKFYIIATRLIGTKFKVSGVSVLIKKMCYLRFCKFSRGRALRKGCVIDPSAIGQGAGMLNVLSRT